MKFILFLTLIYSINSFAKELESFDKVKLRKEISKKLEPFSKCYSEEIKTSPDLGGKVVFNWDIDDKGEVKNPKIESSELHNTSIERCLILALKMMKFPAAPKGTIANIKYPMVFVKDKPPQFQDAP